MIKKLLYPCLLLLSQLAIAQNTLRIVVTDDNTHTALPGASAFVKLIKIGATADTSGVIILKNIPNGKFEIAFSMVGYAGRALQLSFPLTKPNDAIGISLEPLAGNLAEVTVQTTRTNQNLRDIPTRIEALPAEELDEKSTMKPGDIKMLLMESTGIAVQQTSAVSGTANVRIQGLDSRYTQLLKDGMPLYQGFSGGLSLMQISPLDLKQAEYIKGSASTLYGGGAIAGLVNLISKTPAEAPELTFLLNSTTARGFDASGFYAQKWKHIGTTLYGAYNYNGPYDPLGTGFTALPLTKRYSFNPRIFLYADDKNTGWLGLNGTYEDRLGGDVKVINGLADHMHQYFERNKTYRVSTQLSLTHKIDTRHSLNFKNTVGYFDRKLDEPGFDFSGKQLSSFSELNYVSNGNRANWVSGVNLWTDNFTDAQNRLNYNLTTAGAFAQNNYKFTNWFSLESGIRVDYNTPAPVNNLNGYFILPRINALFKLDEHFTSRIGGGLGYKMPTLFTDVAEEQGYQNIQPISLGNIRAEQSYGGNADINYRGPMGDSYLTINQLFFYTDVEQPLILQNNSFVNAPGYITTQSAETNVKLTMNQLGLYLGYTFTDTKLHYNGTLNQQPLTPKNRVSFDLTYEIENSFRAGAESFYTSKQLLSDGSTGRGYVTFGLLVQKMWKHLDVYVNCEDLTDRRQSRWDNIYTGTITNPVFKDVYTSMEGVVVNAGVRIKVL